MQKHLFQLDLVFSGQDAIEVIFQELSEALVVHTSEWLKGELALDALAKKDASPTEGHFDRAGGPTHDMGDLRRGQVWDCW